MAKKCDDIDIKRQYAKHTIKWCSENMGINTHRKFLPKVSVRINFRKDENERFIKGIYYSSENRIIVYHVNCCSIEDVVSTIIHEYTHYLQSMKKYWEYFNTHNYSTHPYERQARRNEIKHIDVCMKHVKKRITN